MPQADFAYSVAADTVAGLPVALALSVFADRAHLRDQMRDDAGAAGFRVVEAAGLAALLDENARPLGAVVLSRMLAATNSFDGFLVLAGAAAFIGGTSLLLLRRREIDFTNDPRSVTVS